MNDAQAIEINCVVLTKPLPDPFHAAAGSTSRRVERIFVERCGRWGCQSALQIGDSRWTYGEIDARSNRLANQLRSYGVKLGDIVALAAHDIADFAIGSLAIMKSGAAYLAIDSRFAVTRVLEILVDAAPVLLLTSKDLPRDIIPPGLKVVRNFNDANVLSRYSQSQVITSDDPNDAAYICYTSGSTGRPKGVIVAHRGIEGLASDPCFLEFRSSDRVGQTCNFAFDGSIFELWGSLLNGSCLVQVPQEFWISPSELVDFIDRERLSVMFLTTSLFNAIATRRPDAFGGLRTLIIGGEAADPTQVGRVLDSANPPRRLLNGYGPTEATTFSTWHEISRSNVQSGRIPIGKPLRGRTVHVLDSSDNPAEPGAPGELCVGGAAVAKGYLNAPELTAKKFIPDPFSRNSSDRLYRTGDLCRTLPNGSIEYLGRMDEQFKVRGFRIEPNEIAANLLRLPGVEEAAVIARDASFGTKEILAFVRGSKLKSADGLRSRAAEALPDYMLPTAIHLVKAFPLNASGKIDKQALLERALEGDNAGRTRKAPENETETRLLEIWQRVLQRQDIGVNEEFWDLGGDSMSIMELALEIESEWRRSLTVDELTASATIKHIASLLLRPALASIPSHEGQSRQKSGGEPKVFLIGYPWALSKITQDFGDALSGGRPWQQVQVPLSTLMKEPKISVEALAAHVERCIRAVSAHGPYILGGHSFCGLLAYEIAQRFRRQGSEIALLVIVDTPWRVDHTLFEEILSQLRKQMHRIASFARLDWATKLNRFKAKFTDSNWMIAACLSAQLAYRPRPYDGRAVVFRCTRGRPAYLGQVPWKNSWREMLLGKGYEFAIDADHGSVASSPDSARVIAEKISAVYADLERSRMTFDASDTQLLPASSREIESGLRTAKSTALRYSWRFRFGKLVLSLVPYRLLEEGFHRSGTIDEFEHGFQDCSVAFLEAEDLAEIAATSPWRFSKESMLNWQLEGRKCLGLKRDNKIVAAMWIRFDECESPWARRMLKDGEAYLYAAYTLDHARGKGLAPYLRYQSYKVLAQMGITAAYSYSEDLNLASIRFKRKLKAKVVKRGLHVAWSGISFLRRSTGLTPP